jgi:polar amino acid transport system substrate-binding protein
LIATLASAERSKQVLFSNPYSANYHGLAEIWRSRHDDLKSVSISVARASTRVCDYRVAPAGHPLKRFDDDATALQALISGQVSYGGEQHDVAQSAKDCHAQHRAKITLREQANGMAFRKSDTALQ